MANKLNLFTFGGLSGLPGKLSNMKDRWSQTDLASEYVSSFIPPSAVGTRGLAVLPALYEVLANLYGVGTRDTFLGKTKTGDYVAELHEPDGTIQMASATKDPSGQIKFSACIKNGEVYEKYPDTRKGTVLMAVLLGIAMEENECASLVKSAELLVKTPVDDASWDGAGNDKLNVFSQLLCGLSTNLYYRATSPSNAGNDALAYDKDVKVLRQTAIKRSEVREVIFGTPGVFTAPASSGATASNIVVSGLTKGHYSVSTRQLTAEEDKMVPNMPSWYIFPKWTDTIAQKISLSGKFEKPIRSLLLVGPAGAGKTKGAQALAYLFGLPYTKITCSPDSSMFDFVGQLIPNTAAGKGKSTEEALKDLGIPSFDDVEYDFEGSYEKLFGEKPGTYATPGDCYAEITRKMMASGNSSASDFVYVESELIRALKNGWFVEIQEPTVIKRNSVLVGLNGLLEDDLSEASITLMTGETIKRHPDAIVCMTTNKEYDGCNNIQQSVLSRMQVVRKLGNPAPSVMAERCAKETGFPAAGLLLKMSEMISSINTYCNENDITDGVCGPRELSNWAKEAMLNASMERGDWKTVEDIDVIRAAFPTLLSKASQTDEDVESIISGCFQNMFSMNDVEMARNEYEEGAY